MICRKLKNRQFIYSVPTSPSFKKLWFPRSSDFTIRWCRKFKWSCIQKPESKAVLAIFRDDAKSRKTTTVVISVVDKKVSMYKQAAKPMDLAFLTFFLC